MLKRNAALLIVLGLGASAPDANAAPAGPETLSGALTPGWNLVAVPFASAEVPAGWLSTDVVVWPFPRPNNPASPLEWSDPGSKGDPIDRRLSQGGYWVHAQNPQTFHIRKAIEAAPPGQTDNQGKHRVELPAPPAAPIDAVFLGSHHTQSDFESGARRVVRWDAATSSYVPVTRADDLKPSEGAFVLSEDGPLDPPDGNASSVPDTALAEKQPAPWIQAGTFEPPEPLAVSGGAALMARAALSTTSTGMTAHLAYVVQRRATAGGDEVRYQFSDKAGKPGSFSTPRAFSVPKNPGSVLALALAARADRVSIAWIVQMSTGNGKDAIEGEATDQEAPVQVMMVESRDGGRSFGPQTVVRKNEAWKRGIDVAFDARLNQHLVWGEANKVYYLMNTEGPPSNVFDNTYRVRVHEEVKYLAQEAPTGDQGCACPDCWCEESYVRGGASNVDSDDAVETESYRVSRYVLDPTLHVGKNVVHVAAQQTRLWDPKPVPHPAWTAMLGSPVYEPRPPLSDSLASLPGPRLQPTTDHAPLIRRVVGWRSVWKTAYEPGDEALWDTLGFQFQYRYAGTWQEEDHIVLAQRPLTPMHHLPQEGSPKAQADASNRDEQPTRAGDTVDAWQVSTLASGGVDGGDHQPSYPKLVGAPFGLVLAYEDGGPADPGRIGNPSVQVRWSTDEGRSWSDPNTVGRGARPTAGVSETGDIRVLYRRAHHAALDAAVPQPSASGVFAVVGHRDQHPWSPPTPVDPQDAGARRGNHESQATGGTGTSLAVQGDLFFAAWADREHILTSRASRDENAVQYSVALPDHLTQGKKSPIKVTAENRHHMRVNTTETLSVATPFAASQGAAFGSPQSVARSAGLDALAQSSGDGAAGASSPSGEGTTFSVSLIHGQATFQADPKDLRIFGAAGAVELASFPLATGAVLIEGASGPPKPQFSASAHGNYEKAKWLRDTLWKDGPLTPEGRPTGYQVEYQAVRDDARTEDQAAKWLADSEGKTQDSSFLAQYERVWAYTQGIALAQYAKRGTQKFDQRAQALARYVCAHAVRDSGDGKQASVIRGWPFSWNTKDDTWKDARLVTGATAWVVHGLGVFLVSDALPSLPEEEQKVLRGCYQEALWGLRAHQRSIVLEDGRHASLVSAGWTTAGLSHARSPWQLMGQDGKPMALDGEHWDYYDILDAIGYDTFDPDREVRIARAWERPFPIAGDLTVGLSPKVLTEPEIGILKQARRAENIVTEHNLDVLSVLNHALEHAPSLGLGDETAELVAWRDGLRRGIFGGLFDRDDHRWRQDLEGALEQAHTNPTKQAEIKQALWREAWGRVSTGGGLRPAPEHAHAFHFVPSKHTAIDNCSWLSLSVDYKTLTDSEHIDALARCLEFTALAFGKDIRFGKNTYYGAHYFFDGFEDPYIQATNRQEQSFHLEATAGLVMGLLAFVEHHPKHHKSTFFEREAHRLWGGVQAFVIDHDFPYSSQRILDLSTLLNSSTALIWFIDAYENLNEVSNRWQQPLLHYASDVNRKDTAQAVQAAHEGLKRSQDVSGVGLALAWFTSAHAVESPPELENKTAENLVPSWVRELATWWANKTVSDDEFITAIEFLIAAEIIHVDISKAQSSTDRVMPSWFRENVQWLDQGLISELEFLRGIERLVDEGVIGVNGPKNTAPTTSSLLEEEGKAVAKLYGDAGFQAPDLLLAVDTTGDEVNDYALAMRVEPDGVAQWILLETRDTPPNIEVARRTLEGNNGELDTVLQGTESPTVENLVLSALIFLRTGATPNKALAWSVAHYTHGPYADHHEEARHTLLGFRRLLADDQLELAAESEQILDEVFAPLEDALDEMAEQSATGALPWSKLYSIIDFVRTNTEQWIQRHTDAEAGAKAAVTHMRRVAETDRSTIDGYRKAVETSVPNPLEQTRIGRQIDALESETETIQGIADILEAKIAPENPQGLSEISARSFLGIIQEFLQRSGWLERFAAVTGAELRLQKKALELGQAYDASGQPRVPRQTTIDIDADDDIDYVVFYDWVDGGGIGWFLTEFSGNIDEPLGAIVAGRWPGEISEGPLDGVLSKEPEFLTVADVLSGVLSRVLADVKRVDLSVPPKSPDGLFPTRELGVGAGTPKIQAITYVNNNLELRFSNPEHRCYAIYRFTGPLANLSALEHQSQPVFGAHQVKACENTQRYLDEDLSVPKDGEVLYILQPAPQVLDSLPWPFQVVDASPEPSMESIPPHFLQALRHRGADGASQTIGHFGSQNGAHAVQLNLLGISRALTSGVSSVAPMPLVYIEGISQSAPYTYVEQSPAHPGAQKMTLWGVDQLYWDDLLSHTGEDEYIGAWLHQNFIDPFDFGTYTFALHRFSGAESTARGDAVDIYRIVAASAESEPQGELGTAPASLQTLILDPLDAIFSRATPPDLFDDVFVTNPAPHGGTDSKSSVQASGPTVKIDRTPNQDNLFLATFSPYSGSEDGALAATHWECYADRTILEDRGFEGRPEDMGGNVSNLSHRRFVQVPGGGLPKADPTDARTWTRNLPLGLMKTASLWQVPVFPWDELLCVLYINDKPTEVLKIPVTTTDLQVSPRWEINNDRIDVGWNIPDRGWPLFLTIGFALRERTSNPRSTLTPVRRAVGYPARADSGPSNTNITINDLNKAVFDDLKKMREEKTEDDAIYVWISAVFKDKDDRTLSLISDPVELEALFLDP